MPILNQENPESNVGVEAPTANPPLKSAFLLRAMRDLKGLAEDMRARRRDPSEILLALAQQGILWTLRALEEGHESGDGSEQWRRRSRTLASWLLKHDGTATAEAAVAAVERDFAENVGGAA